VTFGNATYGGAEDYNPWTANATFNVTLGGTEDYNPWTANSSFGNITLGGAEDYNPWTKNNEGKAKVKSLYGS